MIMLSRGKLIFALIIMAALTQTACISGGGDFKDNNSIALYDGLITEWNAAANRYINDIQTENEIFDFRFYNGHTDALKTSYAFYDIDRNGTTELLLKKQNEHGEDIIAYIYALENEKPVNLFGYTDQGLPIEVPWSRVGSSKILDNGLIDCSEGDYRVYKIAEDGYSIIEFAYSEPYDYPDEASKAEAKWRYYINGTEVDPELYIQALEKEGYSFNEENVLAEINWIE